MPELAQNMIVGAMILAAAAYVLRRSWLSLRGRSNGCGAGCGKCGSDKVVVELKSLSSFDQRTSVP